MKNQNRIANLTVILGVLSFVCLLGHFLALHDIFHGYASPKVLQEQAKLAPGTLPEWSTCTSEWRIVEIGFWLMLAFHIAFLANAGWNAMRRNVQVAN